MRIALISIAGPMPAIAGKTLARRQLEFALAAECESVIALGDGASTEAIALRHAAEAAGARFQAISDAHGLLGSVRPEDELLALAPGLLPEAPTALEELKGRAVLVLPAGAGVAAGFERIDLERAWAGALVVGGAQVERLSDLPADIEPASALVRIAMQGHVKEQKLPDDLIADGSWTILRDGTGSHAAGQDWLKRHLPAATPLVPSRWLADRALRPFATRLLAAPHSVEALATGALAVLAGAVVAAWYGLAAFALALVPVGAVLAHGALALARLKRAPFGHAQPKLGPALLPGFVDVAILACAALAIDGDWLHRLFPPLVMFGALHAVRPAERWAWAGDRGVIAAVLAVAAGFGAAEPAVMLLALALIGLNLAQLRITAV